MSKRLSYDLLDGQKKSQFWGQSQEIKKRTKNTKIHKNNKNTLSCTKKPGAQLLFFTNRADAKIIYFYV